MTQAVAVLLLLFRDGTHCIAYQVYYLIGDHLGSTSSTVDAAGTLVALTRYKPFGEQRYAFGDLLTDYKYTQRSEVPS